MNVNSMSIDTVDATFSVKDLLADEVSFECGFWKQTKHIRGTYYSFMIVRDAEGLYTAAMSTPYTEVPHTNIIAYAASLPEIVRVANDFITQFIKHDVTIMGVGERVRVLK